MRKFLLLCLPFVFFATTSVWAQERTVTGKVSSAEDGSALPGVNVVLKGTTNGAVTDADGHYTLNITSSGEYLVFSFIGLQSQEIFIGDRTTIDVELSLDVRQLSEVVVTGSGVATEKRKLGISVESITSADLPMAPTASIDQALIGKIAGAQISTTSGNPGDPVNIVLRGINTVQGGTKPLIMMDGIQMGATDLGSIDLSNVERVEVTQGAAASALYGAQGANGVIQIFSKKGKKGPVSINFSTSYAQNEYINNGNVNKADKHSWLTDANNNIVDLNGNIIQINALGSLPTASGTGVAYENPWLSPTGTVLAARDTRWAVLSPGNTFDKPYDANLKFYDHIAQIFQKGYTVNNSLSISGANDLTDFSIAASNTNTLTSIMKNGHYDRTNLSVNVGTELFKNFKLRSTTQLVYTKNDIDRGLGGGGGTFWGLGDRPGNTGLVWDFLNTSQFFDLTWTNSGGLPPASQNAGIVSVNSGNPYYDAFYSTSIDKKIDVIQNFNANYKINKFLTLDATYGLNYRTQNVRWTWLNQSQHPQGTYSGFYASNNKGEIVNWQYTNTFQNFIANAFITTDFQEDFGLDLPITTSTQLSYDYRKRYYTQYGTYGLGLPLLPPINVTSTASQAVASDYIQEFVTFGYLLNQKFTFGEYGGVTAGFRSDYSSAFGGGSKPFTFPHYDGFIAPSAFNFWDGIETVVPYFKLRAAYGEAGIQPGAFDRYEVYGYGNMGTTGLYYGYPATRNDPTMQVEVSKELELGTDFTVSLNNNGNWLREVNVAFTYWDRSSENVIYAISQPPSKGYSSLLTNAIDMSSNGIQFSVNIPVLESPDLKWDFTTNFGKQTSQIDAIAGGADIILTTSAGSSALTLAAGQKIGQIFGYKALTSVDQTRPDGSRYIAEANVGNYTIVDGRVVNINTKAIQWEQFATPLGDPNPAFNMSFINNLKYKNFLTLGFQFDWVYKSHVYNQVREWMYRDGIHKDFATPVTIAGETGAYSAYYMSAYAGANGGELNSLNGGGNATKDYFYEDASFLRLRNVSLGIDIAKIAKIKFLKKMELVLTGRNILTITDYTGFDPEISSATTANSAFDRGVDNGTMPNIKSYQVGLNVSF
jgi:TonB-dependent starch-binding outer membrane protein SusC